jgi:hypothetical protein
MNIAVTIIEQMGGAGKLKAFVGAKDFMRDDANNAVMFKHAKGKNKACHITIALNAMDTYDVTFKQITRKKDKEYGVFLPHVKVVSVHEGIYCDMLVNLFESETGLYLSF